MKTCSSFSRRMVKKEKAIRGPWFMSIWQNAIIFLCHSPIKIFHFTFINHSKSFSPKKISNPSDLEDIFSLHFFPSFQSLFPLIFFYQLYNVVWEDIKHSSHHRYNRYWFSIQLSAGETYFPHAILSFFFSSFTVDNFLLIYIRTVRLPLYVCIT